MNILPFVPTVSNLLIHHYEPSVCLTLLDVTCPVRGCTALKTEHSSFCPNHTCLVRNCSTATSCELYCSQRRLPDPDASVRMILTIPDCCAALSCQNPRDRTSKPENSGKYCPLRESSAKITDNVSNGA
jgi:hypothetical protein